MKPLLFLVLTLPALGHHGQDFLVTLDASVLEKWEFRSFLGGEYTEYEELYESSLTQSVALGLPHRFSLTSIFRFADEGSGSWNTSSLAPMLQWTAPELPGDSPFADLRFSAVFGWEIPLNQGRDHSHDDSALPLMDCSGLIGIPPLFQACQLANASAANHTHDDGGHGHDGIHRHGESHGFLRLISEYRPTPRDRLVFNTITVFPEDDSPSWGYATAYRHSFSPKLALGIEAIGDFRGDGDALRYHGAANAPAQTS
jgi:hypothetical protein